MPPLSNAAPHAMEPPPASPPRGRLVIVTGISGAGKSTALAAFEDFGYEAVDNLPLTLLAALINESEQTLPRPLAVGIDVRSRNFAVDRLLSIVQTLRRDRVLDVFLLFLDADDDVIAQRYTETRRRHPISQDLPLTDGIELERRLFPPLRAAADLILDTSHMPAVRLKIALESRFATESSPGMAVMVQSFAFRNGLPQEADLVFDVRFLRNPYYESDLRPLSGLNPDVGAYIAADPDFDSFFLHLTALLSSLLPRYDREGKSYLTIAVGCSGGKHRSVFVAERLARRLKTEGRKVVVRHRDKPDEPAPCLDTQQ